MKKESVMSFIDRRISESLVDGIAITIIQKDIDTRAKNMARSFFKEMSEEEFEKVLLTDLEKIESSRLKYVSFYVVHARQRILDLNWLMNNKRKFPRLSNSQIFNLIKLKEKLKPNLELSV